MGKLEERAMVVILSTSSWGSNKSDRDATATVERTFNTKGDVGKFTKKLMPHHASKIQTIMSRLKKYHYDNTVPWGRGRDLLMNTKYFDYTKEISKFKGELERAVQAFKNDFTEEIEREKNRLEGLFKLDDYPNSDELTERYKIKMDIEPVPLKNDLRVQLHDSELEALRETLQKETEAKLFEGMKDVWKRLYDVVNHMQEILEKSDAKGIKDAMIENVIKMCDLVPDLNMTDDPNLEAMRREIESKLTKRTAYDLKYDDNARNQTAKEAENILKAIGTYV
jgi:hypothetical protein